MSASSSQEAISGDKKRNARLPQEEMILNKMWLTDIKGDTF